MGGLAGYEAWRWIFIMEGLLTVVIGIMGYIFMVNFPEESHNSWGFLTEKERDFVIRRLNRDRADAETPSFSFRRFFRPVLDWKIWFYAICFL